MKSKLLFVVLTVVVLSPAVAAPALAMDDSTCNHYAMTIESLHHCVDHAVEMGHITNAERVQSLYAKLDAAQAALDRGQTDVAVNILNAFINQVGAQSGKLILDPHGEHLIMHAEAVICALTHPAT
jgi:hypothetical protein